MNAWFKDKANNGPYWFRWTYFFLFSFVVMSGIFIVFTFGVFLLISFIVWEMMPFLTDGSTFWFLIRMILALSLTLSLILTFAFGGKDFVNKH